MRRSYKGSAGSRRAYLLNLETKHEANNQELCMMIIIISGIITIICLDPLLFSL